MMAERLTDVAGLVLLGGLGVTALPRGPLLLGGITLLLIVGVIALRSPAVGRQARRILPVRLVEPVRLFVHSGRALLSTRALAVAVGLSVASWFFECLAFSLILDGVGIIHPLRVATFVYAFASLAGAVSMLPGGLGVAEGSLTGLLAGLGTPLPEAAAATLARAGRHAVARRRHRRRHPPRRLPGRGRSSPDARVVRAGSRASRRLARADPVSCALAQNP